MTRPSEKTLAVDPDWYGRLCRWLGQPIGPPTVTAWPLLLIPQLVNPEFAFPPDALQIYQRLAWAALPPTGEYLTEAQIRWSSSRQGSTELGVTATATLADRRLAEGLMVARLPGDSPSWGARGFPRPPEVAAEALTPGEILTVDEDQVRSFANLVGAHYPIHEDPAYARRLGYRNILVQGLLLVLIEMHRAAQIFGTLEMWFRRPIPARCAIERCQVPGNREIGGWRMLATGDLLAVTRLTSDPKFHP